jgi:23S rRNA pseudouridine955/2504/2580 synthase
LKELSIGREEAGRRLDRYLMKLFPKAPKSFLYKALRTNKIKVNGRKPLDLNYLLQEEDILRIFFTDEQCAEFGAAPSGDDSKRTSSASAPEVPILYEDENLLILNKPVGLLSQKDHTGAVSLTEIGIAMMQEHGAVFSPGFTPGVCNRLDRNTAGAVIMAKNLRTAQVVQQIIADKRLGKFYSVAAHGWVPWTEKRLTGYWYKNERTNTVTIEDHSRPGSVRVESLARRITTGGDYSLLEVQLLTGKGHQIRAQLAKEGYPVVGDSKYGAASRGGQLLCASRLVFPECPEPIAYMSGREIKAPWPAAMTSFVDRWIWQK